MTARGKTCVMHVAQSAGGVDRYLHNLLDFSDTEKFEHILVCSQDYNTARYKNITSRIEVVEMYRLIGWKDFVSILKVRKLIKKYQPDIVYAHSSKAGAIVRIANLGLKPICIYNPHGWAFNIQGSRKKQQVYRLAEQMMAPLCKKIVCISNAEMKSALANNICKPSKLQVIINGIELDRPRAVDSVKQRRLNLQIPEDAFVVGVVGRVSTQKSPDIFIRAAKLVLEKIPNAHFLMVGNGSREEEICSYAKEHGFADRIHITGWVDNPLDYTELFDVATLLSRWEGFGLVIPEYMLCEKPVVATAVDAIPEIITNEYSGLLVPPEDPVAASQAIIRLYRDPGLRQRLVENARKEVREKYDARRVSAQHEALFQQLLQSK